METRPTATVRLEWARSDNVVQGFLPWVRWSKRTTIPVPHDRWRACAHEYPGVYLFADSEACPDDTLPHRDPRVIYVGESEHLGRRWGEYQRWIPETWGLSLNRIWVAAFPTWLGDDDVHPSPLTTQFRLYTERRIIWDLVQMGVRLKNTR